MKQNEKLVWSESNGNHKIYKKENGTFVVKKHSKEWDTEKSLKFVEKHAPELFNQKAIIINLGDSKPSLKPQVEEFRYKIEKKPEKNKVQGKFESIAPDFHKIIGQKPSKHNDFDVIKPKSLPGILATAYQEAEKHLATRPCDYAVMGLGSMARQEATTFSDLEFCIIVDSSRPSSVREYFKDLTRLVQKDIIKLGESGTIKKGIRFDSWDKTPLGKLDLINNQAGFLEYLQNKDNETLKQDMLLHMMLGNPCFVYGKDQLFADYHKAAGKMLQAEYRKGNDRFEKMFFDDRTGYLNDEDTQNPKKLKAAQSALKQCQDSLNKLKDFVDNKYKVSLDVKIDIYRPIQSAIEIFAGAKGWFQESMFQLPYRLKQSGKIDEYMKNVMLNCANYVQKLRLKVDETTQGYQDQNLINDILRSPDIYEELALHYKNSCELLGFIEENI